jgi:ABC-type lipoprotein export system ATPase subunit
VAIARALIKDPAVLLADEPTGNLNSRIAKEIMSLVACYAKKLAIPVVVVSHDYSMREYFDLSVEMSDLNGVNKQC